MLIKQIVMRERKHPAGEVPGLESVLQKNPRRQVGALAGTADNQRPSKNASEGKRLQIPDPFKTVSPISQGFGVTAVRAGHPRW
jgi:hypothetical protein